MKQTIDSVSRRGLVSARNRWIEISKDTWDGPGSWDINGFIDWMETECGIKLAMITGGDIGVKQGFAHEFEVVDEQKYMFYVLKYCS